MKELKITSRQDEKCVVYSDDRKRDVRVIVVPQGPVLYCGMDIAACIGYEAPTKAVMRSDVPKHKCYVPWLSQKRRGASETICFDKKGVIKFIADFPAANPESVKWILEELLPKAETLGEIEKAPEKEDFAQQDAPTESRPLEINAVAQSIQEFYRRLDSIILEAVMLKQEIGKQF